MKTFIASVSAALLLATPALAGDPKAAKGGEKAAADCHHPAQVKTEPRKAEAEQGWVLARGEKLKGEKAVSLQDLLKKPEAHDGKTVAVEAKIRKACAKKGCWMELATDDKSPGVRVTFKDYAFFVPLDSGGAMAKVEGVVKVAELTEGHAKHYEEEGAIVPRGKDGKPREVQLVASGVELRR